MISKYYTEKRLDEVLDRINLVGLSGLTITEKNILRILSEGDYEIDVFIQRLNKLSKICRESMESMENNQDSSYESNKEYMDKWTNASRKMNLIEHTLKSMYDLNHNDYQLDIDSLV